ncbi:MAG: hypothetical protein OHK0046_45310 [Anaerolineae bacterium]
MLCTFVGQIAILWCMNRKAYPSDEEWAFVAPYLTLMSEDAPQREHSLSMGERGAAWHRQDAQAPIIT